MILLIFIFIQGCFDEKNGKFNYNERLVVDGELEPIHPVGGESEKTIEGIDINGNGVRDGLERLINRWFLTSNKRNAAKQIVKYKTLVLLTVKDKEKNIEYIHRSNASGDCLRSFNLTYEEKQTSLNLHSLVVNNEERKVLSKLADINFGGQVSTLSNPSSRGIKFCEFKIVK